MSLIEHPQGNYRFLPGIAPYSCGVVSIPGFEIVHVTFQQPIPYRRGFEEIAAILDAEGRPKAALCAIALRSPRPFTFPGFAAFNEEYTQILKDWGLFVDGVNPVARTNVAPVIDPPDKPVLYSFSFTKTCPLDAGPTFVVAGAGELPEGVLSREEIIALGDISPEAMSRKSRFVMDLMQSRLVGLGGNWSMVNTVNVYTRHSLAPLIGDVIRSRVGAANAHGVVWHYTRPPIEEIEFEMDLRGTRTNRFVSIQHG